MDDDYELASHRLDATNPKTPPRRRRPALSCTICRRRKLKCDRALPCGQCVKSKTPDSCVYAGPPGNYASGANRGESTPPDALHASGSRASPTRGGLYVFDSKHPSSANRVVKPRSRPDELQELRHRVQTLEAALSKTAPIHTPDSSTFDALSTTGLGMAPDQQGVSDEVKYLPQRASFRGKNGKTRFCGRTYYGLSVSFFGDVLGFLTDRHKVKRKDSEYFRLKRLKGELWSREKQDHQAAYREKAFRLPDMIPHRRVADELLNLYLSTFETTYRILHVPTFLKQYEAYWASPESADMIFIAKLLAVMAASSCFFGPSTRLNEKETLRSAATGWILAIQSWISSTFVSSAIEFDLIQIQCILMIARQVDAADSDLVWISSGSVIRSAMTLGLHRSPSRFAKVTKFWAELRRRLWATILELDLQSSLDGGMPSCIDLDEFDCEPPSGYDDADLTEDMTEYPIPTNPRQTTRSTLQALLSRSLPLRVRIAKQVNNLKFSLSYDDALLLSEQLVQYLNEGLAIFPDYGGVFNPADNPAFARSFFVFLMRRFMLALHRPFSLSVRQSPKFSYSRKVCLESSLEMLSQLEPPVVSLPEAQPCPHLGQLGGGMFRDAFFHAAITVCVELSLQSTEFTPSRSASDESSPLNALNDLVRSQRDVLVRTVERTIDTLGSRMSPKGAGFKSFLFLSLILASVKARFNGEDPQPRIEQAGMKAIRDCEKLIRGTTWTDMQEQDSAPVPPLATPIGDTPDLAFDPASLSSVDIASISLNYHFLVSVYSPPCSSLLTTIGLRAAPGHQIPNYGAAYIIANWFLANCAFSTRVPKIYLRIDHNVAPREDLSKAEAAVASGKISRKALNRLKRQEAAHHNAMEGYPFFVAGVLLAMYAGVPNETINKIGVWYTASRLAHALTYVYIESSAWSYLRSIAWWSANASCITAAVLAGKKL
ncbi:hypothetical protein BDV59DRAFT_193103 [Aspergillus ambiguus]|uniref:putative C6 transcription factor n=1 Tax=Aspergillus ambiguus TaxID=176160 RepID=UPI003CCE5332